MAEKKTKSKSGKAFKTPVIKDEILAELTLRKRYAFLNKNLAAALEPDEINFLQEVERFTNKMEKKVDHTEEDFFPWIAEFGAEGYVTRSYAFENLGLNYQPSGLIPEFMRVLATDFFDPQFCMSMGATVLAVNPLKAHHDNVEIRLQALKELVTGKKIGCLCITEPERGSDATRMLTTCRREEKGLYLNGTKIFQTNGPKADWAVVYAAGTANDSKTISQSLVKIPAEGLNIERVNMPCVPHMWIGRETFKEVFVPNECVMGEIGTGMDRMFEGLVLERLGIAMLNIAECWGAVTHAAIYSNLREQMGQPILLHQGVGFTLTDLWAKTTNLTLAILQFCHSFDSKFAKYQGEFPAAIKGALVASASQLKYACAGATANVCYEAANLMGGAGVCDNTMMADLLGISRIQEMGGGTRQIQQYIMSRALRTLWKM